MSLPDLIRYCYRGTHGSGSEFGQRLRMAVRRGEQTVRERYDG